MPRVRLLTPVATERGAHHAGELVDVDGPTASAWARNGNAELVRGEPVETADAAPAKSRKKSAPAD